MRRGHPGIGNWRGENPRHFRPRGGGTPHFRPTMPFGPIESNRFQSPGQRYRGPRPYNSHQMHGDDMGQSDHDRPYRGPGHSNNQSRVPDRHDNRERQILPILMRGQKNNHGGSYNQSSYYEGHKYSTNNMGDVDHRARDVDHRPRDVDHRQNFGPGKISPWINPPFERRSYHNEKSPHKTPKHHNAADALLSTPDYSGHRPPSSDHYSDISGPNNNNNPYSRSVDDTVDIVRKRLMNRDCQNHSDPIIDHREVDTDMRENNETLHEAPQEQPVKKRIQRQRLNCDKMKNKIVHQLFKMDKGKIHKLMDNPNSSSKFEYAISSLITESQNSFNRHMRSVAEKSLNTPSSSSDFIHDDNNTIYEDTFMRQMQGILDPQDTILLEDIKPLVLAELSKVLRLDDFDRYEGTDEHVRFTQEEFNYRGNEYPNDDFSEQDINHEELITGNLNDDFIQPLPVETPLFERRSVKRELPIERSRSRSTESWQPSKSTDNSSHNRFIEEQKEKEEPRPLFDGNCDQLSEDEDPFAELDNQYHVAVDHNFIEREDGELVSPIPDQSNNLSPASPSLRDTKANIPVFDTPQNNIIKEIDNQLQSIAKSPLKILVSQSIDKENAKSKTMKIKQEIQENVSAIKMSLDQNITEKVKVKQESTPEKLAESEIIKTSNSHGKHISRKRSVDTKPSHRKEKRKKSSHSECHEAATSIINMFYEKPPEKDNKSIDSKGYSDKNVKKKEPHHKPKEKEPEKPKQDTSKKRNTSNSNTTPKDTSNSSMGDQTPTKVDKVKLTAIDIFSEGPKPKKDNIHQAHRNTSTSTPLAVVKNPDENKIKPIIPTVTSFARKLSRRHMGTQVIRKLRNKECQTLEHKKNTTGTQTDPVKFDKNRQLSEDPLERMKEIDMEIQMLLQEKFKLYNSMETRSKDSIGSSSSMGTLGMAVLNVPIETEENEKEESEDILADSIAEDFTNLPVEELEQIAMETIQKNKSTSPMDKRSRNRKKLLAKLSRNNSVSPTSRKRKTQTPNISLLEQIISDDRPIEEIISLDALESTPVRSKKKQTPRSTRRKTSRKQTKPFNPQTYNFKNCSVVLNRLDVSRYLQARADELKTKINLKTININNQETEITEGNTEIRPLSPILEPAEENEKPVPQPIEEPVNDIQIDMMEVCEDIVIGDEMKTVSDVEERVPVNEEIILDNSQSSVEYPAPEITEGECKMYDYSTDDILKRDSVTVTGNADAVLAIECVDNSFIAACLDGNVYHYTTDGQLVNTLRGSNLAVTCLTIVKEKHGTTVYTGSLDSRIRYYDLDTGVEKGPECNVLSPIQTMDRAWDTVFVGTRTGFVLQFECKNNMLIPVSTVKFSEQSILALRAMKEGPRKVLLVAARSDNVTIKDAQTGLLLRTLEGPKMTVYSLLFEDGKVYCGTSSHQIHVFDYVSGGHVLAHSGGKGAVCLRAEGGLVFAGCYDGCVYVFREAEPRPLAQLRGPHLMLLSLAIHGTKIIAGYKDRSLYIWKIPLGVLQEMIL